MHTGGTILESVSDSDLIMPKWSLVCADQYFFWWCANWGFLDHSQILHLYLLQLSYVSLHVRPHMTIHLMGRGYLGI